MSDGVSSVPKVPRRDRGSDRRSGRPKAGSALEQQAKIALASTPEQQAKIVKLTFPSRFDARFPAPDDEPDSVDQVDFGLQYFLFVIGVFTATTLVALLVFVPLLGAFV